MFKKENIAILIAVIALFVGLVLVGGNQSVKVGGTTNYDTLDVTDGYYVDGSPIIDGSGALSATTGTFSSTLSVTGFFRTIAGMSQGGQLTISTTSASYTLTAAQMKAAKVISIADTGTAALALTLPATSTMTSLIANTGDTMSWVIDNLHTAAATSTTITAGTGIGLQYASTSGAVINGASTGVLECWRRASTNVLCTIRSFGGS